MKKIIQIGSIQLFQRIFYALQSKQIKYKTYFSIIKYFFFTLLKFLM